MDNYFEKLATFNKCVSKGSFKDFSDGYHTFGELYHHRAILSSIVFNMFKAVAWKSKKHDNEEDDPMYDNMFIVGIQTPEGQATYHYHLDYWDLFDVVELDRAPKWDGHTPEEAIRRIASLNNVVNADQ